MNNNASPVLPFLGDADFATRDAIKQGIAAAVGIRVPTERVPRGESLLPSGEEKLRDLRTEYARLPLLAPAVNDFRARLVSENAKDVSVSLQRVRMSPDNAGLYGQGLDPKKALGYSDAGLSHVATFVKPPQVKVGFASNLMAMPVGLRAQWFNTCAERSTRDVEDKVVLRTLLAPSEEGGSRRVVRAVVSERHSQETGDDLAVLDALDSLTELRGAKARITRQGLGDRTWVEILWPAVDRQIRVGDSLAFGIRLRNSEIKQGSLVVEPFLFDAVCYNLTTAYSSLMDEDEFSLRHVGDLRTRLPRVIAKAKATILPFVQMFSDAYRNPLPATFPTRGEVLARLGKVAQLPESTLELAQKLWDADGSASAGNTLAGLANALTRASQGLTMSAADEVEKVAGKVISQGWASLN